MDTMMTQSGMDQQISSSTSSIGRTLLLDNNEGGIIMSSQSSPNTPTLTQGTAPAPQLPPMLSNETFGLQRKRSRLGGNSEGRPIEELLKQLQSIIEQVIKKSEKGKNIIEKMDLNELLKEINAAFVTCLAQSKSMSAKLLNFHEEKQRLTNKVINCLDEKVAMQQQIIELQTKLAQRTVMDTQQMISTTPTYLQAALKQATVSTVSGKRLPIPIVPDSLSHAPAENILIFKAKEKGISATKREQDNFRREIKVEIGEELAAQIMVIRPTKAGGYTVIFQNNEVRQKALTKLRENETRAGVEIKQSCIIAPQKKLPKAICREPPEDCTTEEFLIDFYSERNPHLQQIPKEQREAKITVTTNLGWIFDLSSREAAACFSQGGKVRYGYGNEVKVEEFVSLQQCYRCCAFGHNAADCLSEHEYCRLCGLKGHTGKDCFKRDERDRWSCVNCKLMNEQKGYDLPTNHAAAQLHKCAYAQNQKIIKKEQLAAAGVFTTPFSSESVYKKFEQSTGITKPRVQSGVRQQNQPQREGKKKERSRSRKRVATNKDSSELFPVTASSKTTETQVLTQSNNRMLTRTFRESRPRSTEGWKTVIGGKAVDEEEELQRGRGTGNKTGGTNSTSNLPKAAIAESDTQMR